MHVNRNEITSIITRELLGLKCVGNVHYQVGRGLFGIRLLIPN